MQLRKRIKNLFQPKALVLMYHRIAERSTDPWGLAVTPQNFEQHLQVLQKRGTVISTKKLVASLQHKSVPDKAISLTFDDGYADNYLVAKPLLEIYNSPATFFIPTNYTGQKDQFWWDEIEDILLKTKLLPEVFSLTINGQFFEFDLGTDNQLTERNLRQQQLWRWPQPPPTRRCELYLKIWELIRPLPFNELKLMLDAIKSWCAFSADSDADNHPMTNLQLAALANHPLIDLGLHTHTHPALSFHSAEKQYGEIELNKNILENICSRNIGTLAYPYGSYNTDSLNVARSMKLTAAFTTAEKIASNLSDPLQLGRFQVRNWNGNEFENWLVKWQSAARFL